MLPPHVQVGIPSTSDWQVLHRVEAQALEGLFSATEKVLQDSVTKYPK